MYRLNSATTLPPLLLVLTLGVNPHFSSTLFSLLLSYNLTTATVCWEFASGPLMSRELSQLNRYLWNLRTTFQNCLASSLVKYYPVKLKQVNKKIGVGKILSMHKRHSNQCCGANFAIKGPVLSLLLFSTTQEKIWIAITVLLQKEKTWLQSSD